MLRIINIMVLTAGILCMIVHPVLAQTRILTGIKVIHASTGSRHVDPGLEAIVPELTSVFKYTSYQLLKDDTLNLIPGQRGEVTLPGNRTLVIFPQKTDGSRIPYDISIQKRGKIIFKTRILLNNNSSITIGGPQFNNGTLLFNISGSAS